MKVVIQPPKAPEKPTERHRTRVEPKPPEKTEEKAEKGKSNTRGAARTNVF